MRVLREPVVEALHVLFDERVAAYLVAEVVELLLGRQLAPDQEVARLEERRVVTLDELLDGNPAVAQDVGVAVDVGDRRLARSGVDEAVVERDEAGSGPQLRDVDGGFVLGATDDRELDLVLVVAQDGGGFAHLRLLHLVFFVSSAVLRSTGGPCRRGARRGGRGPAHPGRCARSRTCRLRSSTRATAGTSCGDRRRPSGSPLRVAPSRSSGTRARRRRARPCTARRCFGSSRRTRAWRPSLRGRPRPPSGWPPP